jgi:hypothetical protein
MRQPCEAGGLGTSCRQACDALGWEPSVLRQALALLREPTTDNRAHHRVCQREPTTDRHTERHTIADAHTWTTTPACSKRAKEGEQRATAHAITPPTLPFFGHSTADAGTGAGDTQLALLALILLISISAWQRWCRAAPGFFVCSRREG